MWKGFFIQNPFGVHFNRLDICFFGTLGCQNHKSKYPKFQRMTFGFLGDWKCQYQHLSPSEKM